MSCGIFSKTISELGLFQSNDPADTELQLSWLKSLIPAYSPKLSGIWMPIIIRKDQDNTYTKYASLLSYPKNIREDTNTFSPLACTTLNSISNTTIIEQINMDIVDGEDPEDGILCSYCDSLYPEWKFTCNNIKAIYTQPKCGGVGSDGLPFPFGCCGADPVEFTWPPSASWSQGEVLDDNSISADPPVTYSAECCDIEPSTVIEDTTFAGGGGCDTRMKSDDTMPAIPYLYNYYITSYRDFKYLGQFPAIENGGLGCEKFISTKSNNAYITVAAGGLTRPLFVDWILKPRIGEIEPDDNDTYHVNQYAHKSSYSRFLKTNKTCGNFILHQLKKSASSDPADPLVRQTGLFSNITGLPINSSRTKKFNSASDIIPTTEAYTIPYGITNSTYNNIFLGPSNIKAGSYWKWNTTSGVLCWYRYFDKDRYKDSRIFPGIDLYVSDGEVFFAENDGPEPLPIKGASGNCISKTCPSGLKLLNYENTNQPLTVIPSGSEFLYVSNNIYNRFYSVLDTLLKDRYGKYSDLNLTKGDWTNNKSYKEIVFDAAILATSPQYDGVITDSKKWSANEFLRSGIMHEFRTLLSDLVLPNVSLSVDDLGNPIKTSSKENIKILLDDWLAKNTPPTPVSEGNILYDGRDEVIERLNSNTIQTSYNHMGYIHTQKDLINTLIHKYGSYIFIPKNTIGTIEIQKSIRPHASIQMDFEPVFDIKDTFNSLPTDIVDNTTCADQSRGSTKQFYYDQAFSIGGSKISTGFDDTLYYNKICLESTDPATVSLAGSTKIYNVYFNDSVVYRHPIFSDGRTRFETVYSRFPSVSSSLSKEFLALSTERDRCSNFGTFTLKDDKRLLLKRIYNGYLMNSAIDMVAFHEDGGAYYDSNLLSSNEGNSGTVVFKKNYRPLRNETGKPSISFRTNDNAIKIYSIDIDHLRTAKNTNCKTLPLNQPCKCWGLDKVLGYPYRCADDADAPVIYETPDLYTPPLSSRKIPLKSYGGYSDSKVTSLLGDFRIPDHPEVGSTIPQATPPNDSLDCSEKVSITLGNYVYSEWEIKLPKFLPDRQLWVTMTDSLSMFTNRQQSSVTLIVDGQEIVIYANSQNMLSISSDSEATISVKITDTFYTTPIENKSVYFNCTNPPARITLTFYALPKKNIINFHIPPLKSQGVLKKGFFHPNTGLDINDKRNGSSLLFDKYTGTFKFDHEQLVFSPTSSLDSDPADVPQAPWTKQYNVPSVNHNHSNFYAEISHSNLLSLNKFMNALDFDKKLKLYIKYENKWWSYEDHKTFGFYNTYNKTQYYGWPTFFKLQYTDQDNNNSPLIPSIPKVPLEFIFFNNVMSWLNVVNNPESEYPYFKAKFIRDNSNPKRIYIDGARLYFRLPHVLDNRLDKNSENKDNQDNIYKDYLMLQNGHMNILNEDNAVYPTVHKTINGYIDTNYSTTLNKAKNIYDLISISDVPFKYTVGGLPHLLSVQDRTTAISMNNSVPIVLLDKKYWYMSSLNDQYTHLDFPQDIITTNYVTNKQIVINNKNKFTYDINKSLVRYPNNIQTVLDLKEDVPYLEGSIGFAKSFAPNIQSILYPEASIGLDPTLNGISLTLFATTSPANMLYANNQILYLDKQDPKNRVSAKWSDLYYFTNLDILNDQVRFASINQAFGPFAYNNMLNNIIANNFMYSKLAPGTDDNGDTIGECYNISNSFNMYGISQFGSGLISINQANNLYYIHQQFSAGDDYYSQSYDRFNLYKNYNPIIDINLYTNTDNFVQRDSSSHLHGFVNSSGLGMTGICMISGINRTLTPDIQDSSNKYYMWVNINDKFVFNAIPIRPDTPFYSKSFVVNDAYTMYDSITLKTERDNTIDISDCTSIIIPSINVLPIPPDDLGTFDWSRFVKFYLPGVSTETYDIFCDTDTEAACNDAHSCSIKKIGRATISTRFKYYRHQNTPIDVSSLDNIEFAIGLDAGLYCPLSITGEIPYIVRSVQSDFSPIFGISTPNKTTQCIGGYTYPSFNKGFSLWDQRYQDEVDRTKTSPLPIDHLTNEMIFRMIHGASQNINLNSIDKNYTASDGVNLSTLLNNFIQYPSADNIKMTYNYIPLDYDPSFATSNRIINGQIDLYGNIADMAAGKTISITYNDNIFTISYQTSPDGDILLVCPELEATGVLVEGGVTSTSTTYYVREVGNFVGPPGPNTTEKVISTCVCGGSSSVNVACGCEPGYGGNGDTVAGPWLFVQGPPDVGFPEPGYYGCSSFRPAVSKICEASYRPHDYMMSRACGGVPYDFHGYTPETHARSRATGAANRNTGWFNEPNGCAVTLGKCSKSLGCCGDVIKYQYPINNCHYSTRLGGVASTSLNVEDAGSLIPGNVSLSANDGLIQKFSVQECVDSATQKMTECWESVVEDCTCKDESDPPVDIPCVGCIDLSDGGCDVFFDVEAWYECVDLSQFDCVNGPIIPTTCCGEFIGNCEAGVDDFGDSYNCSEAMNMTTSTTPDTKYELVESKTTTSVAAPAFNPAFTCPFPLGSFLYDNEKIELKLGRSKIDTNTGNVVANGGKCSYIGSLSCPSIKIELPNSNFTINESTNSRCDTCPPSQDTMAIEITKSPEFELKRLSLQYMLGVTVIGGSLDSNQTTNSPCCPNSDYSSSPEINNALFYGKGCTQRTCGTPLEMTVEGGELLGPWLYFLSEAPWGGEDYSGPIITNEDQIPSLIEGGRPWTFSETITNPIGAQKTKEFFIENMTKKFNAMWPCTAKVDENDLIQGIVPGSCKISFQTYSHPLIAIRYKSIADGCTTDYKMEKSSSNIQIISAVVEYDYIAPKTVTDYIIDTYRQADIPSSNYCFILPVTNNNPGMLTSFNLKEELSTTNITNGCKATSTCYDKGVNPINACNSCDQEA
jgi:hypothetical protein